MTVGLKPFRLAERVSAPHEEIYFFNLTSYFQLSFRRASCQGASAGSLS